MLSQAELREVLNYDPATGNFTWKKTIGTRAKEGRAAGSVNPNGYVFIQINRKLYVAHRLAWMHVHGIWSKRLDHKDRNRANNAIDNLRESTRSENGHNKAIRNGKTVPYKGVWYNKIIKRYQASVMKDRKAYYLGCFKTAEAARDAYVVKAKELYGEYFSAG